MKLSTKMLVKTMIDATQSYVAKKVIALTPRFESAEARITAIEKKLAEKQRNLFETGNDDRD